MRGKKIRENRIRVKDKKKYSNVYYSSPPKYSDTNYFWRASQRI